MLWRFHVKDLMKANRVEGPKLQDDDFRTDDVFEASGLAWSYVITRISEDS